MMWFYSLVVVGGFGNATEVERGERMLLLAVAATHHHGLFFCGNLYVEMS